MNNRLLLKRATRSVSLFSCTSVTSTLNPQTGISETALQCLHLVYYIKTGSISFSPMCRWGFTPLSEAERGGHKHVETILKLWTARWTFLYSSLKARWTFLCSSLKARWTGFREPTSLFPGLATRSHVKRGSNYSAQYSRLKKKSKKRKRSSCYCIRSSKVEKCPQHASKYKRISDQH